jgi:REP element-mobilizing transposase RayT
MARLAHIYEPGMTYLLTAVTYQRHPLFAEGQFAQVAHEDVAFYTRKFKAASLAHVVMPDHVHWVIYPSPEDFKRFVREERQKNGKYAENPERFYLSKGGVGQEIECARRQFRGGCQAIGICPRQRLGGNSNRRPAGPTARPQGC